MLPSKPGKGVPTDNKLEIELNVSAAEAYESAVLALRTAQRHLRDLMHVVNSP